MTADQIQNIEYMQDVIIRHVMRTKEGKLSTASKIDQVEQARAIATNLCGTGCIMDDIDLVLCLAELLDKEKSLCHEINCTEERIQ